MGTINTDGLTFKSINFEGRNKTPAGQKITSFLLLLFLFFSLFILINRFINRPEEKQTANRSLEETVLNSLKDTKGTYAVAVKNLKTGEGYSLNENRIFEAGSLYKLWVMAEAFKQIEEGTLKEDQELSAGIADLNMEFNISSDEAELNEGGINLTVSSALNQMITISHNYAALLLTKKIRLSEVANFLKENDFKASAVGINGSPPKSTAKDLMNFYEKLYREQLGGTENTEKMIALLKNQKLNDGLPKYLPQAIAPEQNSGQVLGIAHKTGDIGPFKHDAGIVFTEKGDYIIVVMSESNSPQGAQERIAELSKAVFEYFTK